MRASPVCAGAYILMNELYQALSFNWQVEKIAHLGRLVEFAKSNQQDKVYITPFFIDDNMANGDKEVSLKEVEIILQQKKKDYKYNLDHSFSFVMLFYKYINKNQ
jgi:hypothetical protein